MRKRRMFDIYLALTGVTIQISGGILCGYFWVIILHKCKGRKRERREERLRQTEMWTHKVTEKELPEVMRPWNAERASVSKRCWSHVRNNFLLGRVNKSPEQISKWSVEHPLLKSFREEASIFYKRLVERSRPESNIILMSGSCDDSMRGDCLLF